MDRYDRRTRSRVMARVKKSDTKLEGTLTSILRNYGLVGYKRYLKDLPGSPDFAFLRAQVAVFLDSCFWHGCPKHLRMPKSNLDYWQRKIAENKRRDRRQTAGLRHLGWSVVRLWEHELRDPDAVVRRIRRALDS